MDALVAVLTRNAFYKRQYVHALCLLVLSAILVVVLGLVLYILIGYPVQPLYFATDKVGRLIEVVPVNRPNMSNQDVVNWTIQAVEAIYSYDYVNYPAQLQSTQKYFTSYGWSKYMSALTASNNLLAIKDRKMVMVANVVTQPTLITEGLLGGAYAWKFNMPVLVTYAVPPYDEKSKFSNPLDVTVIVQRQPVLQSYEGLGILQLIGSIDTNPPSQVKEISNTLTMS